MSGQCSANRRILIVDDNTAIHEDFRKILEARGSAEERQLHREEAELFGDTAPRDFVQFELHSAYQGQEGYEMVRRAFEAGEPYALAFVDIRMPPGWDGVETTARIREIDPRIQVVICSAYSDYSWEQMLARLGRSDRIVILKKPFENVEVLQMAHALTEKWNLARENESYLGTLEAAVRERTKELELANHQLHAEMRVREQTEGELQDARQAAEAANRAKSQFLANMSHEIRTPMNGIMGITDLLLSTPLNSEQVEFVSMLKTSGVTLLRVIDDILDFSKIEAGKVDIERISFSLREWLKHTVGLLNTAATKKGLKLVCDVPEAVPDAVLGDPTRLGQVVRNLVSNALKFTAAGEIKVSVALEEQNEADVQLHFRVQDTGIGIPTDKQGLIFAAFTQVDSSTTRRFGGTGLGLSICRGLVSLMGGRIWLESESGKGTTFHFTARFGLSQGQPSAETAKTLVVGDAPGGVSHSQSQARPGLRILLVEDNAINQHVARVLLQKRGHTVCVAENGQAALTALQEATFDLVLMDVQMPDMDGFEATTAIRKREAGTDRHVPIVALTAHALTGYRERCLAAGMDGYISKPIQAAELDRIIDELSAQPSAPQDELANLNLVQLDESGLLNLMKNETEAFAEIHQLFLEDSAELLRLMAKAITDRNPAILARAAHDLRGSAGNFGAGEACRISVALEELAHKGRFESAEGLVRDLAEEIYRVNRTLAHLQGDFQPRPQPCSAP